ncbi:hypothetical protein TUM12370_24780 [Salmonella enterica subsp. enterica serovar Choleraesuis]|nr:hypothetical protein TUM12370_24780 [Salmonella enterica subsp. enterica serovar Choleraesuis]
MGPLFALVLTIGMTDGSYQDSVLGVYTSQKECEAAAVDQHVDAACYPVEGIIHTDGEAPAV